MMLHCQLHWFLVMIHLGHGVEIIMDPKPDYLVYCSLHVDFTFFERNELTELMTVY